MSSREREYNPLTGKGSVQGAGAEEVAILTGRLLRAMTATAGVACVVNHAAARNEAVTGARPYPVKAIRFIVAASPGGPADTVARSIAPRLAKAWGQQVVVDNRPGANGIIGIETAARAAPDGYTIVMVTAGIASNPSLYSRVPYDPVKDFAPVTLVATVPNVLLVSMEAPFVSVTDLIAAARARPGTITFGSAGKGSSGHLALELLQLASGARFAHVPAKGVRPALADLLAGEVQVSFGVALASMPHVRAGRLRGLAVTSAERARAAPELPTMAESGFPGYEVTGWFGVLAPARTPAAIVDKLNAQIVRVLRAPEVEQHLLAQATDPIASSPAVFGAHIAAETRKWTSVVKATGIKRD